VGLRAPVNVFLSRWYSTYRAGPAFPIPGAPRPAPARGSGLGRRPGPPERPAWESVLSRPEDGAYDAGMARRDAFLDHLAEVPIFSALSRRELALIARRGEDIEVPAGKVLVREGATGSEFFVIVSGQARVSRRGRRVATLGPGDAFGELALLDKAPRNATVVAETPMELVVLGQREFAGIIDEVPGFARKLLAGMARRLREADAKSVQ